jgi:hypothetical protein
MKRWEYTYGTAASFLDADESVSTMLDRLGRDGWELVAVGRDADADVDVLYFKRETWPTI